MSGAAGTADRREALAMAAGVALLPLAPTARAQAAPAPRADPRRGLAFDADWRFFRGVGEGFERPALDDRGWRRVDLPHDWSVEDIPGGPASDHVGPFDKHAPGGTATGFTVGGEGWYRKHFRVDGYPRDARIEILFDGVYLETDVYLNGTRIGGNLHGYIPFALDLTPHLDRVGDNVVAVRVRNLGRNSRWYSGSGIYRSVTLDVLPADGRIARWGVAASTRRLADGRADVRIVTRLVGAVDGLQLVARLRDADRRTVAEASAAAQGSVEHLLSVRAPRLWSPGAPNLHSLELELRRGGTLVDRLVHPFGIRIVTFDPQRGMAINGTAIRLRGGCIHHDNGLLGACAFADADERRIRLLKARGYNAIRSSHNPASQSLRDACDRLGMLLIEEAFDAWHEGKQPDDFSVHFPDHWREAIEGMVLAARNSPSVIMWSIGNEIPYRSSDVGVDWAWKLANAIRRLDPTRPVTAGLNGVLGPLMVADASTARAGLAGKVDNASTIFLDVPGYNYRLEDIEREEKVHPERVVYASETFASEVFDYRALSDRAPYFLGEFVWTAMDYIGEAGVGATAYVKDAVSYYSAGWPWVNAWCGDIDLIGEQKAASLARDVAWDVSPLALTVQRPIPAGQVEWVAKWGWPDELESWSWDGSEGKPLLVRIYSTAARVEVWLNSLKVGERMLSAVDKSRAEFAIPYAPGTLEARAYTDGRLVGRRTLASVGPAALLRASVEGLSGRRAREALVYIPITVCDARARSLPDDRRMIAISVSGPAELVAFGSANPHAVGSLQMPRAETFRGRALAILRGTGTGTVRLEARSPGLKSAATSVVVR